MTDTKACTAGKCKANILLIAARAEHVVNELEVLAGDRLDIFYSNVVDTGTQRALVKALRASWFDPLLTMLRLAHRVWSYGLVIAFYGRNGYWLGLLRALRRADPDTRLAWIGFAPNPRRSGLIGRAREAITYRALLGCDIVICNSRSVIEASKRRYPKAGDRFAYVRWGGTDAMDTGVPRDGGYIFAGGRTNRDFRTVCQAVMELDLPTIFATGRGVQFPADLPSSITVHRDVPGEEFQRLVEGARVVVVALDHPEVSSGQVVLNRAMRSEKPVIVTRNAGIDEYLTDGTDGVLVEPHNVDQMKTALAALFNDQVRRDELGRAARHTYETRFNERVYAHELAVLLGIVGA